MNFGWITAATLANANITAVARDAGNLPVQVATAVCSCGALGEGVGLCGFYGSTRGKSSIDAHTKNQPTSQPTNHPMQPQTVVVGIAAVLGAWALHDPVYVAVLVRL